MGEAQAITEGAASPIAQARALQAIAGLQQKANQADAARASLQRAAAAWRRAQNDERDGFALQLAWSFAKLGDINSGQEIASTIADEADRQVALDGLFFAVGASGRLDEARRLANTISDPNARAQALAMLALNHAQRGQVDEAIAILREALAGSAEALDPFLIDSVRIQIVDEYMKSGQTQKALAYIADVDEASAQPMLARVVEAQAKSGDIEGAHTTADRISEPNARESANLAILRGLLSAGEIDTAREIAQGLTVDWARHTAFEELAVALAAAGRTGEAETALRRLGNADRTQGWSKVAEALAERGDFSAAQRLAEVGTYDVRLRGLLAVARRMIDHDRDQAIGLMRRVAEDEGANPSTWREVGEILASVGDAGGALAVVQAIGGTEYRARALRDIGVIQYRAGHPNDGRLSLRLAAWTMRGVLEGVDERDDLFGFGPGVLGEAPGALAHSIAIAQARAGDAAEAVETIGLLDGHWRVVTLAKLALGLDAGD